MRAWHFFSRSQKIHFRESGSPNSREKHLRNLTFRRRRRQLFFFFANCCKLWDGDVETNNLISIFSSLRAGNRCERRHRFPPASESGSRPLETKVVCCVRGGDKIFSLLFLPERKSGRGSIGLFMCFPFSRPLVSHQYLGVEFSRIRLKLKDYIYYSFQESRWSPSTLRVRRRSSSQHTQGTR